MSSNRVFNQDGEPEETKPVRSNMLVPHVQLTPGIQELFIEQIALGASDSIAAKYCGLLPSTVEKWIALGIQEGPGSIYYDFMVEVNRWRSRAQRAMIHKLVAYVNSEGSDPKFIPKVMTTLWPEEFGSGSRTANRIEQTINIDQSKKILITGEELKGASPEYKNMVISATRESMGLSSSVYEEDEEEDAVSSPADWIREEQQQLLMRQELDLSDID